MSDLTADQIGEVTEALPAEGSLDTVRDLCEKLRTATMLKEKQEAALDTLSKIIRQLADHDLPDAMVAARTDLFRLDSGHRFDRKDVVRASIPKAEKGQAHKWLRANGHGDLIKNVVGTTFLAGEDEAAKDLQQELGLRGLTVDRAEGVHAATLSAFCKRAIKAGTQIPLKLLGVYIGHTVKIKLEEQ